MFRLIFKISVNNACSDQTCSNQCWNQSPCAHGGSCTELCDHAKHKFNCTCTAEYYGKLCKKRRPTSCKDQLEKDRGSQPGLYLLFDSTSKSLYEVFCDYTSEAWLTTTSLQTSHFIKTTLSIRIPLPGISFAYRGQG